MFRKSYKLQVVLWSCIISGLVMVISWLTMVIFIRGELEYLVDHDMEALAAVAVGSFSDTISHEDPFRMIGEFAPDSFQGANLELKNNSTRFEQNVRLMAVLDEDGRFMFRNSRYWQDDYLQKLSGNPVLDLGPMPPVADPDGTGNAPVNPKDRWEARAYQKDGLRVILALNQLEYVNEYREVAWLGVEVLPLALLAIGLGGWWIGFLAIRPVKSMTRAVSSIRPGELDKRVPLSNREDEIGELGRYINNMLGRIEAGYAQARRFTEDASHELRTPLAILQAELEAKMRETEDGLEVFEGMLNEVRRLKALTYSLLFLSKIDSGTLGFSRSRVNLSELAREVIEDVRELSPFETLQFEFNDNGLNATCPGDPVLIQQCIMNLVRNASDYNRKEGRVACAVIERGQDWILRIGNTGAGIPPDKVDLVFQRFYRINENRNREGGGFGLGLNIAREIARIHGGDIRISDTREDWVEFELSLPRD